MLASNPMPQAASWGHSWSQEETRDLMALWGEAKVLSQGSQQSGFSNVYIYEDESGPIEEHEHNQSVHECRIKITALWAQWVTVTNHNHWLGPAHKSIPFTQQPNDILMPWDPGWNRAMHSSMGSLPKPPLQPGTCVDALPEEGPSGCQEVVLLCFPPLVSSSNSESPGQCLSHQVQGCSPGQKTRPATELPALSTSSSSAERALPRQPDAKPMRPRTLPVATHPHCQQGLTQAAGHARDTHPDLQLHSGERHQLAAAIHCQGHQQPWPRHCVCTSSSSAGPRTEPGCWTAWSQGLRSASRTRGPGAWRTSPTSGREMHVSGIGMPTRWQGTHMRW
ncbi:uncharacterized protein LOC132250020 [Alligator mississippiensis]|uniref:uncharacterized protein LOC132250020 n=1 Tax=Alligator mississippiensis TaxID=8496 RepID=UPI0028779DF6|nr:uncharacterized protein LOC132250020 [Alligator mississippiensis]